jgi:hypothetical protein
MTQTRRIRLLVAATAVPVLALAVGPSTASPAPGSTGVFEQQLTFDSSYAQGEPSIAVNPTNPKNIVLTFLANVGYGFYGVENGHPPTTARDHEQAMQGCDAFVSFDAGRSWKRQTLPVTSWQIDPTRPNCSDTLVLFDKKGVAYVIGSAFQFPTFAAGQGDFRMISSRDGGRTWSAPSVVSPAALSPGADPAAWQGARFYDDREFMALDRSTGTLYVNGTQGRAAADAQGNIEYLTASHDGGRTWGNALAVGSASAVQLAAAFGTVLFTSPPPQGAQRECTCLDVVVSNDGGRTWSAPSVVSPAALSPGADPAAWQGARFYDDREFMALDRSTGTLYVNGTQGRAAADAQGNIEYLTASRDGGRTWSDALAVGAASAVQLAAGFGTVLFTSPPPQNAQRECTCLDVVVSNDGGRTVARYPTLIPRDPGAVLGGGANAVADPRTRGRFLLAHSEADGLVIYRTDTSGRRWGKVSTLTVPGRSASKVWLDWSPEGVLGLGWRATASSGYLFYGAVSYDAGKTWTVHRISKAESPASQGVWVAGDDTSAVWVTKDRFYATWGDWRTGSLQTFWGGFPLPRH